MVMLEEAIGKIGIILILMLLVLQREKGMHAPLQVKEIMILDMNEVN